MKQPGHMQPSHKQPNNPKNACRLIVAGALLLASAAPGSSQRQPPPVDLEIRTNFQVPAVDAQGTAIVAAAKTFLDSLSAALRQKAVFPLDDNHQRSNWSNLPEGFVNRGGVERGELSREQLVALDELLGTLLSPAGVRNIDLQLAAEDELENPPNRIMFSSAIYKASFLGEPSVSEPWMFQFGGHHLAINATVFGPSVSFAPMLTGGQPTRITYRGEPVHIVERETLAAERLLQSLSPEQKAAAVRGSRKIDLLLGPGDDGTVLAPEGVRANQLSAAQKELLLAVIVARIEFFNQDDFEAKLAVAEAEIDDTYFGWWGPEEPLGAAYFRVTAPSLVLEYSPQGNRDPTDHIHSMFREPTNDYGAEWIATEGRP